jgi:hypothetical protein
MKNAIIAMMLVFGFVGSSYAGECANGVCVAPLVRPVRKIVNITKEIVVAPVRAVAVVAAPRNCCVETVAADCGCGCGGSNTTKEVVKYQPLRRRLVNRSTTVSCCE